MNNQTQRVIVIGATGTIGVAVADALAAAGHEVLRASRNGPLAVDLEDPSSIEAMLESAGAVDAIVSTAGRAAFGTVQEASDDAFSLSLESKLMGQVNLIRIATRHLGPTGSITVTTGVLGTTPGPGTAPSAMVNAGLEGFVRAAAQDLVDGPRVLAVSPPFVRETAIKMGMGEQGMPAREVAAAYVRAVEGHETGVTLDLGARAAA
jgi:NAD(P)-dependent dehydrogenase (short-subunit alcohol dehydrogenase family)